MCVGNTEEEGFCVGCRKSRRAKIAGVLSGIVIGCICSAVFVLINIFLEKEPQHVPYLGYENGDQGYNNDLFHGSFKSRYIGLSPTVTLRKPLYVGVLTMERHLHSRAASCNRTWGKDPLISRVEYFARLSPTSPDITLDSSLINLTDVHGPDLYHRRETFRMLEYICDNHIEEYDWFVRAVDDVYIKPDRLLALLANVDKNRMYYIGHPSPGENELDQSAADGRYYCLGGPAIVFSRPALQGICPHLRECERQYKEASADVEIGRCMFDKLAMQCTQTNRFRERFHNSYERNVFKLVEEFMNEHDAITLHPLKTPWLMSAVHRYVTRGSLLRLSQRLSWLSGREESLAVSVMAQNRSRILDSRTEDLVPIPVTVVTPLRQKFNPGTCSPVFNMTYPSYVEFTKVLSMANASFLYGNRLRCRRLVDGHFLRTPDITTNYVTKMFCHNLTRYNETFVTSAAFEEPHADYIVTRKRERRVKSKLVLFLHTYYSDPRVLEFLVMWKNLLRQKGLSDRRSSDHMLILFLIYDPRRHRHSSLDMEFALSDLDRWKRDRRLNIITYPFNNTTPTETMHQIALSDLDKKFKDAVILLAQPHLRFDAYFLKKCRFLVRPGKHIYRPKAEENMIFRHWPSLFARQSVSQSHWSDDTSPVCIHARDLLRRKKQTKSGTNRKHIKVIKSFDMNLHVDSV